MDWSKWFNEVIFEVRAMSPKEKQKIAVKKYKQTDKGKTAQKAALKKYKQTDKGKIAKIKYRHTSGGKRSKRRHAAKRRRQLGYKELFEIPEGFVSHHIDNVVTVPVPKDIHEKLSGHSRKKHRKLVLEWIYENDPDMWIDCMVYLDNLE